MFKANQPNNKTPTKIADFFCYCLSLADVKTSLMPCFIFIYSFCLSQSKVYSSLISALWKVKAVCFPFLVSSWWIRDLHVAALFSGTQHCWQCKLVPSQSPSKAPSRHQYSVQMLVTRGCVISLLLYWVYLLCDRNLREIHLFNKKASEMKLIS